MLLGCIADDFTGASDLANTLAKGGMTTIQYIGVPQRDGAACDAGVVALKTRSTSPDEAVAQSLRAFDWLRRQGCTQYLFKYCSTFDSTPRGNIGPVAAALAEASGETAAVVCPAFPATGRTVYQGHLFVNDKPLNESGMEHHPLTPMTDADIRRWLGLQTRERVGHISYPHVAQGEAAIRQRLAAAAAEKTRLVVVDAISEDDLRNIGHACSDRRLLTGGSGIALGLPDNFRHGGQLAPARNDFETLSGPCVALSGSCSAMSQKQVAQHLRRNPGLEIRPDAVISGDLTPADVADFVTANRDRMPLVYSTADPARVAAAQTAFGRQETAAAIENFFGQLASRLIELGVRRFAVGGGETSGAVVNALGIDHFAIGPEIDPGVPALSGSADGIDLRLVLKSGNFGSSEFYEKALRALGPP